MTQYRKLSTLTLLTLIAITGVGVLMGKQPAAATAACTQTLNTGANVATAANAAAAGSVICLNAGSYTGFDYKSSYPYGTEVSKASMTTIQAAPGVSQSQVVLSGAYIGKSSNLTFSGMTIGGAAMGDIGSAGAHHLKFINDNFTNGFCIHSANQPNLDITIDSSVFRDIPDSGGGCGNEGRLEVNGDNASGAGGNGIVISNNLFSGQGGCTDGVNITGGGDGTMISGNEFTGIKQNTPRICASVNGAHADPLQFYGASNTTVTGNYFHNNSTGIMSSNGNGDNSTITNNVFNSTDGYPYAIVDCGGDHQTYLHNTFVTGTLYLCYADPGNVGPTTTTIVRDNYLAEGYSWGGESAFTGTTATYNMADDGAGSAGNGAHNIGGTAIFVGGSSPSIYNGFALRPPSTGVTASPGYRAASDSTDIGIAVVDSGGGGVTAIYHVADLSNLVSHYGRVSGMTAADGDLDSNSTVDVYDLSRLLTDYAP